MEDYQTDTFELDATPATVIGNPVEVIEGHCSGPGAARFHVISGHFLESDWSGSGIAEVVGESRHAAPDSLHILWYSYVEGKFYEGHFGLPQQRLHALLKEGFWDPYEKKHDTYGQLTICLLPQGGVAVWLSGLNKTFIGRYQGQPAPDDPTFKPGVDRRAMAQEELAALPAEVQQQWRAGTFTARRWDEYLQRYPWRVELLQQNGRQQQPFTLYNCGVDYLSAEYTRYPPTQDFAPLLRLLLDPSPKAVPEKLTLFVQDRYSMRYKIRVDPFDEAETLAAFQELHRRYPREPITLRVETDRFVQRAALSLTNGFQTLPLQKATIKLFRE